MKEEHQVLLERAFFLVGGGRPQLVNLFRRHTQNDQRQEAQDAKEGGEWVYPVNPSSVVGSSFRVA